jgi:hypothetical protein
VIRTVTAADPLPDHLPDVLDPHPPALRYALTGKSLTGNHSTEMGVRQRRVYLTNGVSGGHG